jgi:hypothetical protein
MMDWHKAGEKKEKKGRRGKIEVYYLVLLVGFFLSFCSTFLRGESRAPLDCFQPGLDSGTKANNGWNTLRPAEVNWIARGSVTFQSGLLIRTRLDHPNINIAVGS